MSAAARILAITVARAAPVRPYFGISNTFNMILMHTVPKVATIRKFVLANAVNVVTADTLRKAKKNPEKYRDLIVRVAGYSDYFVDLTDELQDEIIRRTEHSGS